MKVSVQEGNKLLMRLVRKLRSLPRRRFYYGYWAGWEWTPGQDLETCGTKACALGWATTLPSLQKKGLHLSMNQHGTRQVLVKGMSYRYGSNDVSRSIASASRVFGISHDEARSLFIPGVFDNSLSSDATAKQVANHIEKFVAARKP